VPDPSAKSITPDLVRQVAKLSRLAPDEASLPKLAAQLESILGYVAKVGQANVNGVEPMAHAVPLHNVFRADEPGPTLPVEQVLRNAPETDGPFFKVPKVIGGDEDSAG
jgi:aspartyl-tRNA(Asn)/glutamyl-tRNA(Gln) amidotransferase subunit C